MLEAANFIKLTQVASYAILLEIFCESDANTKMIHIFSDIRPGFI